jgi:MFS family permease
MSLFPFKFALYKFLDAVKPIGVIFVLLFTSNGINPFQISLLIAVWAGTQFILEVPLGTVADKYSRRNLLVIASLIHILGFVLWLKGTFVFYALGFVMWGVKNALVSGTQEALVYDTLKTHKLENSYEEINGRLESAFWIGISTSAILGGLLATINFNLVLLASIYTTILGITILLTIESIKPVKSTNEANYFKLLKEAVYEIKNSTKLLGILVFFCLVFATYGAAEEYWALIYKFLEYSPAIVGILVAIGYGCFVLAGFTLPIFNKKGLVLKESALLLSSACLFLIAGILQSYISVLLIFVGLYLLKIAHLKLEAKFQHAIISTQRATISSLKSFTFEILYIGFVLIFGLVANNYGIITILYILGFLLVLWILIFKLFLPSIFSKVIS